MQQLEAAGHSVDMNDLLLPTYFGHECLLDTDKYMRFSGAQVPGVLDAFESFTSGLIPDVEVSYGCHQSGGKKPELFRTDPGG